ncbi:MAG: AraC family transcriptional regulator [Selenomonas massiliensis]
MPIQDKGVVAPSTMDFSFPSSFVRSALYYTPEFGHFHCTESYHVERTHLDSSLLMFVRTGVFYAENCGQTARAHADEILLVDCRQPHSYGCHEAGDFLWFHFAGIGSAAYTEHLIQRHGLLYTGESIAPLERTFRSIIAAGQYTMQGETLHSHRIDRILTALAAGRSDRPEPATALLAPALDHIQRSYAQPIALEELAAHCGMSASHLIRCFKKHLSCTPHEYLLQYRLRQSKRLLQATEDSIEAIADACGFNSASHFARAFKAVNGMTPTAFRALEF